MTGPLDLEAIRVRLAESKSGGKWMMYAEVHAHIAALVAEVERLREDLTILANEGESNGGSSCAAYARRALEGF